MAIERLQPERFRVDFLKLGRPGLTGLMRRMLRAEQAQVDPFRVALAVRGVMGRCSVRGVRGERLVWNEYKLFLSREDHNRLRPLESQLHAGLQGVVDEELADIDGNMLAELVVRLLVDEESDLPPGQGEVVVAFADAPAAGVEGEVTIRVRNSRPAGKVTPNKQATQRVGDGPAVKLSWGTHSAVVQFGESKVLGRPHSPAPEGFVALEGASKRINSAQLSVENGAGGVILTRHAQANPVQVEGRLIQPGGRLALSDLPVTVELSNGELSLVLDKAW